MSSALDQFEEQLVAASRAISVSRQDLSDAAAPDEDMGYATTAVDRHPDGARPRKVRHKIWAGVVASGTALAGGIVAVIVLLSSGASVAFAGWTTQPARPTAAALAQSLSACGNVAVDKVLASEARGPYVAIVYMRGASPRECVTRGTDVLLSDSTLYPPSAFASPGAGKVTAPLISRRPHGAALARVNAIQRRMMASDRASNQGQRDQAWLRHERTLQKESFAAMTGPDSLTAVQGTIGKGVTGVTFVLADGRRVVATVGHNWYLAWWPGVSTHNAYPVSIRVTTASGTSAAGYSRTELHGLFELCLLNERCPGFAPNRIKLVSGVASVLRSDFSLFRRTPPASAPTIRYLRPALWTGPMGADVQQLRAVSFGRLGTVIAIPGTGGVCVEIATKAPNGQGRSVTGGGGTCHPSLNSLGRGVFMSGYSGNPTRTQRSGTYSITGLVPDGNQTITVRLASGQATTVPVKQNIVFAHFKDQPTTVTYKSTDGRTISFRTGFQALRRRRQPTRTKRPPVVTK